MHKDGHSTNRYMKNRRENTTEAVLQGGKHWKEWATDGFFYLCSVFDAGTIQ